MVGKGIDMQSEFKNPFPRSFAVVVNVRAFDLAGRYSWECRDGFRTEGRIEPAGLTAAEVEFYAFMAWPDVRQWPANFEGSIQVTALDDCTSLAELKAAGAYQAAVPAMDVRLAVRKLYAEAGETIPEVEKDTESLLKMVRDEIQKRGY